MDQVALYLPSDDGSDSADDFVPIYSRDPQVDGTVSRSYRWWTEQCYRTYLPVHFSSVFRRRCRHQLWLWGNGGGVYCTYPGRDIDRLLQVDQENGLS
ncbi:hypothetical protein D3C73_657370 [compost metagenome]